jgi:hypothetical protein
MYRLLFGKSLESTSTTLITLVTAASDRHHEFVTSTIHTTATRNIHSRCVSTTPNKPRHTQTQPSHRLIASENLKCAPSGYAQQPQALAVTNTVSSAITHINLNMENSFYSQYPTKTFGFSVAGKWPTPFIAWCLPPVILSQVAWPISGVLDQSYSPVSMYTGHFLVSILDMRLRPSQPPVEGG